jgi:hypothetical protein
MASYKLSGEQIASFLQDENPVNALLTFRTTRYPLNVLSGNIIQLYKPKEENRNTSSPFHLLRLQKQNTMHTNLSPYLDEVYEKKHGEISMMYEDGRITGKINSFLDKSDPERIHFIDNFIAIKIKELFEKSYTSHMTKPTWNNATSRSTPSFYKSKKEVEKAREAFFSLSAEKVKRIRLPGAERDSYVKDVENFLFELAMYRMFVKVDDPKILLNMERLRANMGHSLAGTMGQLNAGGAGAGGHFGRSGGRRKTRNRQRRGPTRKKKPASPK